MGRPCKGDRPMTSAERKRAQRQRQRAAGMSPNATKQEKELWARVAELELALAAAKATEAAPQGRNVTLREVIYQHVQLELDPDPDDPEYDYRQSVFDCLVENILSGIIDVGLCSAEVDAISAVVGVDLKAIIDERNRKRAAEEKERQERRERRNRHRQKAA